MSDDPTGKAYFGIAYNRVSPTESTTYSDYNWSLIKGEKGDTGVPGGVGADGKTYYTWIKYAAGSTGSDMSDDPTGKSYIGIAYNKETVTESSSPSDYTWSLIKGDTGRGVESITKQYYLSTSSSTPTGGVWQTNIPTWSKGTYLWERSVIVYNNPTETVNADPVINADWGDANSNIYDVQQKVTKSGIVTLINESLASGNQISATKFVMDALGLLIKGGGLTIENNAGTVVLSADSDGNLTFSGQLSGATGTFKGLLNAYNSNGKRLMQVSEGSVKFYDGTDNETVQGYIDSDLGANVANLRLAGTSMISFQAGANTLMSMSPNRMMVYKPIGIGGGYKNYPKTYGSSIIQTVSNTDAVALITSSTINYYLGVSDSGQGNTAVFACNGDGGAASVHVNSATYLNGTWYATLSSTFSGTIRINYVVCYFDD